MLFATSNTQLTIVLSVIILYIIFLFLIYLGTSCSTWKAFHALIITGQHKGKRGLVVNMPSILNLFGLICCISLPVTKEEVASCENIWKNKKIDLVDLMRNGFVPKKNVYVWRWQLQRAKNES